jgi:hypothetical protein
VAALSCTTVYASGIVQHAMIHVCDGDDEYYNNAVTDSALKARPTLVAHSVVRQGVGIFMYHFPRPPTDPGFGGNDHVHGIA